MLTLDVPIGEAILFDMFDWTKIMQMHYIGENESEESAFSEELKNMGMSEFQIMTSNFIRSRKREFRKAGNVCLVISKQSRRGITVVFTVCRQDCGASKMSGL